MAITTLEEARKEYIETYGVNPPLSHTNYTPRNSPYGLMRFEDFLAATGMGTEAVDHVSRTVHSLFKDYDFLIEHFRLLEKDMIAVLCYLFTALRERDAKVYIKQFTTLKRGHQLAFVNSMKRQPGVAKTASLLDAFFLDPDAYDLISSVPLWVDRVLSRCDMPPLKVTPEDHRSMESLAEKRRIEEYDAEQSLHDERIKRILRQKELLEAAIERGYQRERSYQRERNTSSHLQDDPFVDDPFVDRPLGGATQVRAGLPVQGPASPPPPASPTTSEILRSLSPEPVAPTTAAVPTQRAPVAATSVSAQPTSSARPHIPLSGPRIAIPYHVPPFHHNPNFHNPPVKCLPEGPFGPEMMLQPGTVTRYGVVMFDGSIRPVEAPLTTVPTEPVYGTAREPVYATAREPVHAPAPPILTFQTAATFPTQPSPFGTSTTPHQAPVPLQTPAVPPQAHSVPLQTHTAPLQTPSMPLHTPGPLLSHEAPLQARTKPVSAPPAELPPTETHPMRPQPKVPPTVVSEKADNYSSSSIKDLMASAQEQLTPFSLEDTTLLPGVTQEESSIERLLYNLKVSYPPMTTVWPDNVLPMELSFPSPEDAINYAMSHAYYCQYQVVPRFRDNILFLQCSRMHKDDDEEVEMTNRKSCNFALKLDHNEDTGEYRIRHIPNRSTHNHPPNIHPSSLKDNRHFDKLMTLPSFASEAAMLDTFKRDPDKNLLKEVNEWYPEETFTKEDVDRLLLDTQQSRLEGKTPLEALYKLFESPLLRARCNSVNGTIFFAHTQGYRMWRAYPEVVLVDASQGRVVNDKYLRLVMIKGVNCHDLSFPIAACLVEKTSARDPIDSDTWRWIFNQLKDLQKDHSISPPQFIQFSSCDLKSINVCEQVFASSHVYMDPLAADKLERQTAQKYFTTQTAIDSALRVWKQIVSRDSDYMAEQMLNDIISDDDQCVPGLKQFLTDMRQFKLKMSVFLKLELLHFDVKPNNHYEDWGKLRTKPANVFEMVRWLLHEFCSCYEKRSAESGHEYVQTWTSLSTPFRDCMHIISYEALKRVQELMYRLAGSRTCGPPHCFENQALGYPCVHGLQSIIQTRERLAPDDFHPHWRNLYADLTDVEISGQGRFADQWMALKTGTSVYTSDHVEVFQRPVVVENLEGDKENRPPKRHKTNGQGTSEQPIEL